MSVSSGQQRDSVIHIHVSILFQILFPIRLLQKFEQSSLRYTVGFKAIEKDEKTTFRIKRLACGWGDMLIQKVNLTEMNKEVNLFLGLVSLPCDVVSVFYLKDSLFLPKLSLWGISHSLENGVQWDVSWDTLSFFFLFHFPSLLPPGCLSFSRVQDANKHPIPRKMISFNHQGFTECLRCIRP